MDLKTFQQENPDLWPAVQEWIGDGWGVHEDIEITPLMVAAALEKEAITQDACVAAGESDPSYPVRLRRLAGQLARTASMCLAPLPPEPISPSVILALSQFQIIGCLDAAEYESAEADWPHGWSHYTGGPGLRPDRRGTLQ